MFGTKSPEGYTPWDYANSIWGELYQIRRLMEDEGETSTPRWLTISGDPYAGGGLVTQGSVRVPPGCNWTAMAISGSSGSNGADILEVFRNSVSDAGFVTRMVAANGRFSMVNLPDNLVLQENTLLIVRATILAAADGLFPTVNVATREVHSSPVAVQTQEEGEAIGQTYGDPGIGDLFPDREAAVHYQENGQPA